MDGSPDLVKLSTLFANRGTLVDALAERPRTQSELVGLSDATQPTVSRTLSKLASMDVVTETEGRYELTLLGRLLKDRFDSFADATADLYDASEIIAALPSDVDLDRAVLDGATITSSKPHAPDVAITPLISAKPDAVRLRSCTPVLWTSLVKTVSDQIANNGLEAEIIMTEAVAEEMEVFYANHQSAYGTGRLSLYTIPDSMPYGLSLTETPEETYAAIRVCLESGVWGTVVNTSEEAVEWVETRFEGYKRTADDWTPPGYDITVQA